MKLIYFSSMLLFGLILGTQLSAQSTSAKEVCTKDKTECCKKVTSKALACATNAAATLDKAPAKSTEATAKPAGLTVQSVNSTVQQQSCNPADCPPICRILCPPAACAPKATEVPASTVLKKT